MILLAFLLGAGFLSGAYGRRRTMTGKAWGKASNCASAATRELWQDYVDDNYDTLSYIQKYLMKDRVEHAIANNQCWKYGLYLDAEAFVELLNKFKLSNSTIYNDLSPNLLSLFMTFSKMHTISGNETDHIDLYDEGNLVKR